MNIDLLSRMVRELILDNDEVSLPGLGTFTAEQVGAVFADRGYTIQPPYRKLSFRSREGGDGLLVSFYARTLHVEKEAAEHIIGDFLRGLREVLVDRKVVVLPGLGRLRATRENHFFFVADEELDIDPSGFALEPVSLKTHVETADEVASAVAGLRTLVDEVPAEEPEPPVEVAAAFESETPAEAAPETPAEPVPETESATEPEPPVEVAAETVTDAPVEVVAEPAPETEAEAEPEPPVDAPRRKRSAGQVILYTLATAVIICAALLVVFLVLVHVAPDFTDRLLYSREQLDLIHQWQEVFGR